MKVGIFTNLYKDSGLEVTLGLINLLKNNGVEFYLFKNLKGKLPSEFSSEFSSERFFDETNYSFLSLMITVGGDGTVLNIVKDCVKFDIPMLTINKGTKGFLNEIELKNIGKVIDVIKGDCREDKRILISVTLKGKTYLALNEAFITRKTSAKMIRLNSFIDGRLVDKYFCDGLLLSTPTGSTAYSLSAGGPIISPSASVMSLVPVSSHCLHSRPIVLSDDEHVEIALDADYDDAVLIIDGETVGEIHVCDKVKVEKSDKQVRFLRLKETSFYSKLLDKLNGLI